MHPDTFDAITTAAGGPADLIGMPPRGYNAHEVTEPPAVDHSADEASAENVRAAVSVEIARLTISDVATELTMLRMQRDAGKLTDEKLDGALARSARTLRAIVGGLAVLALAVVALVAAPAQQASATEGPQPDPAPSATYRVVLGAAPVRLLVQASVDTPVAPSWYCASLWTSRGMLARSCSIGRRFQIPVTIDPKMWPVGRSFAQVVDDASDTAVATVVFVARRPSKFAVGTWADLGQGQLFVAAPVKMYSAPTGRWLPQNLAPVYVQQYTARGWVRVATLTTNQHGIASGAVATGGGVFRMRVVRPQGATVTATTGTTRTVTVTTEPIDVI